MKKNAFHNIKKKHKLCTCHRPQRTKKDSLPADEETLGADGSIFCILLSVSPNLATVWKKKRLRTLLLNTTYCLWSTHKKIAKWMGLSNSNMWSLGCLLWPNAPRFARRRRRWGADRCIHWWNRTGWLSRWPKLQSANAVRLHIIFIWCIFLYFFCVFTQSLYWHEMSKVLVLGRARRMRDGERELKRGDFGTWTVPRHNPRFLASNSRNSDWAMHACSFGLFEWKVLKTKLVSNVWIISFYLLNWKMLQH